ncbi:hypothetical protein BFC17_09870 [Alteromonas lipolytica]|uniref:DUF3025 domain-containing protein n=1 Tax=Alteromonas lipolytica TaxID=1856405 RepID=A0A1E8FJK8_9ALTE|nr:hypothetical protein BFC17_09870 [Alteromonas lipolytica]
MKPGLSPDCCCPSFLADELADLSDRYYEVFIAEEKQVPTRHNWHDTFNALMWMLFGRTKSLLNYLHCQQIADYGVHPRTAKRNRLTHFDECGLVIAVPANKLCEGNELLNQLALHQWQNVLLANRGEWGTTLFPFIFGHALYEMLLTPFIGLTAKWLAVVVPDNFATMDIRVQYEVLDKALAARLTALDGLAAKTVLKPVPLLGIPDWYNAQSPEFYADKSYFRPLAPTAPATTQLPLQASDLKTV